MRQRTLYSIGACICMIGILFMTAFPCYAAEIGTGAFPMGEERPTVTSVSISPGTVVVSKSTTCAFTASVTGTNNYSREVAWSVSGQTSGNTFIDGNGVLNVASDEAASSLVVKAVSKQDSNYSATALAYVQASTYHIQLQASPENGGTVYGSGEVKEGGYVVISAAPNEGFTFAGWLLNNNRVSQDSRYVVDNIRGDAVYVAEFSPIDCRVTVNVNDTNAGTATESRTVKYGESMTLEAFPKDGYQFDGWTENGNKVSKNSRMQLDKITGDRTFNAVFKKREAQNYTITASVSSGGGTVTPEGKTTVREGTAVMYTITPDKGYAIRTVYVDGVEVGKTSSFNFSDVRGDHKISADFVEAPAQQDVVAKIQDTPDQTENKVKTENKDKDTADYNDDPQKKLPVNDVPKQEETDSEDKEEPEEKLTGTLAALHISPAEAKRLISEKKDGELLEGALKTGDLQINVYNDFADGRQENFGVSGLESAAGQLLSEDEKLFMLQGDLPVAIDFAIRDREGRVSQETKDIFEERKPSGMTIGRYFEITLEKRKKGEEKENVSELGEKIKVALHVPEPLQDQDREFYILGLHTQKDSGPEFVQLLDEDENPDIITFSTDRFSSYAIAYIDKEKEEEGKTKGEAVQNSRAKNVIGAVIVVMALIVTATGIWYIVGKRRR